MLDTIHTDVTVTFNGRPFTGDIQYDKATHLINLLHANGEDEVLTASFSMFGLEPQEDTAFIQDGGVRRGLARSLEVAGVVEIIRSIQIGLDLRVVEVRVLSSGQPQTPFLDRITTKSGSVYEFAWDEQDWPVRGPRHGQARKVGEPWRRIRMVTPGFEYDSRLFWLRDDDSSVHTTRIVSFERTPFDSATAA